MTARPDPDLYRKCPVCYGTRQTRQPVTVTCGEQTRQLEFHSPCPFCADGYLAVGLTIDEALAATEDVRSFRDDRDALLVALGDASQESAEECLAMCLAAISGRLEEVDEARERLTQRSQGNDL